MKSIKEWMFEKGLLGEEFDKSAMSRYLGSDSVSVDQELRRELKNKVERIMNVIDEYKSVSKEEMLSKLKVAISQVVSGASGNRLTSRGLADKLSDEENKVNRSRFADMMGSDGLEVDIKIRRELEPKIQYIMGLDLPKSDKDYNEKENITKYGHLAKSNLEERLIVVVSQLVAEMSGGAMSVSALANRMDSFDDEPIAKEESVKLPSFLRWIENAEEQGDAVSEPQHEEGEDSMDIKGVVEKRMMQMAMDLESKGKGSRKDILGAMKAVVDSAEKDIGQQDGGQQEDPSAQQGGGQPPAADPNMQQAPPQQMQPQVQS